MRRVFILLLSFSLICELFSGVSIVAYSDNSDGTKMVSNTENNIFSVEFKNDIPEAGVEHSTSATCDEKGLVLNCYTGDFATIQPDLGSLKLKLNSDIRMEVSGYDNLYLRITYEDPVSSEGYGWFYITYTGCDGELLKTDNIYLEGTGNVQTREILLNGACFTDASERGYDIDIRLSAEKDKLSKATYNYSLYPVVLKSVSAFTDNTVAPISGEIKSEYPGNIFFDDENIEFEVNSRNLINNSYSCEVSYKIYRFLKEDDKTENCKNGIADSISYSANEEKIFKISIPDDMEYGLYKIEVYLKNDLRSINKLFETDFSVCKSSKKQNYNLGVAFHSGRYPSNNSVKNIAIPLAKKAGIGIIREGITWSSYESSPGEYKLSNRSEALLDALNDYDMNYMMTVSAGNKIYPELTGEDAKNVDYDSVIIGEEHLGKFGTYVNKLVCEPKVQRVLSMIEIVNEPELRSFLYDGQYVKANEASDDALKVGTKAYARIIETAVDAVKEANSFNNTNFKTSAFCTSGGFGGVMTFHDKYIDYVLDALNENNQGKRVFDSISAHPYCSYSDPEIGHYGDEATEASQSVAYRLDYFKGLVKGNQIYDPVQKTYVDVRGKATNNTYSFDIDDEMWFSETGYSSAHEPQSKEVMCVQSEYEQARRIITQSNVLRAYNNNDKICYYNFKNKGDSRNMQEPNFGFIKHENYKVPYAAKYSYLAMAAMNSFVADREKVELFEDENEFVFIAKYSSVKDDAKVLSLWTTKEYEQTITKSDIKKETGIDIDRDNVSYYDMLGNSISQNKVLSGSEFKLTKEPYYIVCGEIDQENDKNLLLCINKSTGEIVDVDTMSVAEFAEGFNNERYCIDSYLDYEYRNSDYSLYLVSYKNDFLADIEKIDSYNDGVLKKSLHSSGTTVNSSFTNIYSHDRPTGWKSINPNDDSDKSAMVYEFNNSLMQGKYKLEFEFKANDDFDMGLLGTADFPQEGYTVAKLARDNTWLKWMTDNDSIPETAGLTKKHRLQKKLLGHKNGMLVGYTYTNYPDVDSNITKSQIAESSDNWEKISVIIDFDTRKYTVLYNNEVHEALFEHLNRQYVAVSNSMIGEEIPENPSSDFKIQNTATTQGDKVDKQYNIKYLNGIKGIWLGSGAEYRNLKMKDISDTRFNLNQNFDNLNINNLTGDTYIYNSAIMVHPWHQNPIALSTDNNVLNVNVNTNRTAEYAIPFKTSVKAGRSFTVEFDYKPEADNTIDYNFIMNLEGDDYLTYYTHPYIRKNSVWGIGNNTIYMAQHADKLHTRYTDSGYLFEGDKWYHVKLNVEPCDGTTYYSLEIKDGDELIYPKSDSSDDGKWSIKREAIDYYAISFGTFDCKPRYAIDNLKVYEYADISTLSSFNSDADVLKLFALDNKTQKPISTAIVIGD